MGRGTARAFRQQEKEADDQQCMCQTEFARCEWPYPRACHMSIERSVCKIVHHDPRATHCKGPCGKDGEQVKGRYAASSQDKDHRVGNMSSQVPV